MLVWAADTEDSATAERVVKLACLEPINNAETREAALVLGRREAELGQKNGSLLPRARLVLGVAEYRHGPYEQADSPSPTPPT